MSTKKPDDEKVSNVAPFGLRMLPELKERIAAAAVASGRSMNAEIVQRLDASFEFEGSQLRVEINDDMLARVNFYAATYGFKKAEDYVASVIDREISRLRNYQDAVGEIIDLEGKIAELSAELDDAKQSAENWKGILMMRNASEFGRAKLLKSICLHIMSYGSNIPPELTDMAEGLLFTAELEINGLKDQIEDDRQGDELVGVAVQHPKDQGKS